MDNETMHEMAKLRECCVIAVLNERRNDDNISFRDLAALSGIAHSTINDIFNRKQLKLWHVYVFAEALGMTLRELVYLSDERFREEYAQLDAEAAETSEARAN